MAEPESPAALVRQAKRCVRQGDPEAAMALCDRASAIDPTYTPAIEVRDLACYMPETEHERLTKEAFERNREGRYEEARVLSNQALAIRPDYERAKKALEDATIERSSSKYSVEARANAGNVLNDIIMKAQAALFQAVADNEKVPFSVLRKLIDDWKAADGKVVAAPRAKARRGEAKQRAKKTDLTAIRLAAAYETLSRESDLENSKLSASERRRRAKQLLETYARLRKRRPGFHDEGLPLRVARRIVNGQQYQRRKARKAAVG